MLLRKRIRSPPPFSLLGISEVPDLPVIPKGVVSPKDFLLNPFLFTLRTFRPFLGLVV